MSCFQRILEISDEIIEKPSQTVSIATKILLYSDFISLYFLSQYDPKLAYDLCLYSCVLAHIANSDIIHLIQRHNRYMTNITKLQIP